MIKPFVCTPLYALTYFYPMIIFKSFCCIDVTLTSTSTRSEWTFES